MMYVIYNNDGSIKNKFLNEFVMQGNAYENVVFVAFEGRSADTYTLYAEFKLPNGSTTTVTSGSTPTTKNISSLGIFTGKCISISNAETLVAGALQMNVKVLTTDTEKVLVAFNTYITVNETGIQPDDPVLITAQEYQNLLSMVGNQVANYQTILKGISLASFGDLTDYTVGQALYVVNSSEAKLYEIDSNYEAHLVVNLLDRYTKSEIDTMMAGKLNKSNIGNILYANDNNGNQTQVFFGMGALGGRVVQRDSNGQINVPQTPTSNDHAASKKYVDTQINTYAAYYITKNAAGDAFATRAELMAASTFYSGGVVRVPTRNDYCYVLADENHDNATTRYLYNNGWEFQIVVNETAFTQAQLDAINSGATAAKINAIAGKLDKQLGTYTVYAIDGSNQQVMLGYNANNLADNLVLRDANGCVRFSSPTVNEHGANKGYVDTNFVAKTSVKTTLNTTSGNVYDVTYINAVLSEMNEKASGLCRNFTTTLNFTYSDVEDAITNDTKVHYYDNGEWKTFTSVAEYTTWRTGKSIGSASSLSGRANDITFSDILVTSSSYYLFIDANEEYYLVTQNDYDKLFKANDNILIPDTDCADRWVFGSHLYALETAKLGYHALGTTSDPVPFLSTATIITGATPSVDLHSLKNAKCSSALTSLTIVSLSVDTNDAAPSWQIQFVADTGFTVTLPVGCTWKYGTPTFNVGEEYTIIIEKRINNDYYAYLL